MAETIIIDALTREITVPESERAFGVAGEHNVTRKHFRINGRIVDGNDLAVGYAWKVCTENSAKQPNEYPIDSIIADSEGIEFDWLVGKGALAYKGCLKFAVCAKQVNGEGKVQREWHSRIGIGTVYDGIEASAEDIGGFDLRAYIQQTAAEVRQAVQDAASAADAAAASATKAWQSAGTATENASEAESARAAAESASASAAASAKRSEDAATKVTNEGVAEKLTEMHGIQEDVKARQEDVKARQEDVKARQQDVTKNQADVTANTRARHSHTNKAVIDGITGQVTKDKVNAPDHITDLMQYGAFQIAAQQIISQIPTVPDALPNPNALTIKIGSATVTYDGSTAQTVEIADGSEVSY